MNGGRLRSSLSHLTSWADIVFAAHNDLLSHSQRELTRTVRVNTFVLDHLVKGGLVPAAYSVYEINKDIVTPVLDAVRRRRPLRDGLSEVRQRFASGGRYGRLVIDLGREIFGSARYEGETRLADNAFFRLSYLPPATGQGPRPAIFHVGGFLPFSDRIFRLLPEANLFKPLLERGFPIYAMELAGDRHALPRVNDITLERIIDTIEQLTDIAFRHNRRRRMVLEGYCGLGMPSLAYVAARPREAEAKLSLVMLMVAPVDGRRCRLLADMVERVPDYLLFSRYVLFELLGGYVSGRQLRAGIDIPLDTFFVKSAPGRFFTGWKRRKFHDVEAVHDLTAGQRKELAGAYWISPENCDRYPIPVDLVRLSTALWRHGVSADGLIPAQYRGQQLSLRAIAEQTAMPLLGIYGGQDKVIPDDTAHVLKDLFGDRYTHVVHPDAGHVSYVFSDEIWRRDHPKALDPNPMDLIEQLVS